MAAIMTKQGNLDNIVTYEHICDTFDDIQTIDPHYITLGSTCVVINGESGGLEVYMADSNKEWQSISITSGEGGGSSSLPIQILGSNDHDSETGMPTIEDPIENIFYLVPSSENTNNLYEEWIYTNGEWEKFGSGNSIQIQTDWNEIDENNPAYIKNRFAYEDFIPIPDFIPFDDIVEFNRDGDPYAELKFKNSGSIPVNIFFGISEYKNEQLICDVSLGETIIKDVPIVWRYNNVISIGEGNTNNWHYPDYYIYNFSITCTDDLYNPGNYYATFSIVSEENITLHIKIFNYRIVKSKKIEPNLLYDSFYTVKDGLYSHAEGYKTKATGDYSHTQGYETTSSGQNSHSEGKRTVASGQGAHAEGEETKAKGYVSHSEGYNCISNGRYSHAEGNFTQANGEASHSEGNFGISNGSYSHAEGYYTTTNHRSQHVFGEYNILDNSSNSSYERGNYIEIVGNGDNNTRSNARTLDWNGNEWLAGNLKLNQTTLTEALILKLIDIQPVSQLNVSGTDLVITATQNTRYICGEVSTLDFTPCVTGICDIRFTSGSSKTILTLPNTVKMPDWFEVEANMTYEISIMDGVYGVVTSWAV